MKRTSKNPFSVLVIVVLLAGGSLSACGGDGGGPPMSPPPHPSATTFRGNLARMTARHDHEPPALAVGMRLGLVGKADAQDDGVQVCIDGTTFCANTDANGSFVLVAPVSGNIVLLFTGVDFTARLTLAGIPMGAVVSIRNIECSTSTGRCAPQQMDIEAPTPVNLPLPNEAPICGSATANPPVLFPPNHTMVTIIITGVADPDGDAVMITPTRVFQDEPVLGTGDGNTAADATLHPLAVRAERSGQGNGRMYTVDFVADDGHGASCSGRVRVCVPHDQRPGATCVDDGPAFDSAL